MRIKQLLTLGLAVVMTMTVLAGCGGKKEEATQDIFEAVEEPAEEAPAEEEAEPEDPDVPPAEGMERSHFTNEWVDASVNVNRPIAVMYPVNKQALPQYGYDKISVFYEIMEEGDMSRQLAILEDWEGLEKIGNIRSIRDYFVYAALEYDPVIIHFGGPALYVSSILLREDVDNLNGTGGSDMGSDYGAYFRDPPGSKSEHTAYTSAEKILSGMEKGGFEKEHRDAHYYNQPHFNFVNEKNVETLEGYDDAVEATEIDMSAGFPATKSALTYNEEDGLYYKTIYGNPQVDAVSGNQLAFTNVIVQNAYYEVRDAKGYLAFRMHDTEHDGYYITQGKMIHVTWKKEGDYLPTQFFDDNGNEIKVNTGKTCIFVNKEDKTFNVNGTSYGAKN